jgi:hypothetical protein
VKSSNRFLLWFGIAITALIAVVITLVLVTKDNTEQYPADTPEGVVQRFFQVVKAEDYPQAFSYLRIVEKGRPLLYQDWLTMDMNHPWQTKQAAWRATIGQTTISGNTATVEVIGDVFRSNGLFDDPVVSQTVLLTLTKIDGTWFITMRPSVWWIWY